MIALIMDTSLKKLRLFVIIPLLFFNSTVHGIIFEDLPEDDRSAIMDLEEGLIDSTVWDVLESFYYQPLSVPDGELRILRDVLPHLPDNIPVSPKQLSIYQPWASDNIDIFFKDFPSILPFKPLLSFETQKDKSMANIAFYSHLSGISDMVHQSARFSGSTGRHFRTDGTLNYRNDLVRWNRRRITLMLPLVGDITIGNFSFVMNSGLFYGYFPSSPISITDAKYNWLYGGSRSWNGLSNRIKIGQKSVLNTFFHIRETEKIAGVKTEFIPTPYIRLFCAFSGAATQEDSLTKDTSIAIHCGFKTSLKRFSVRIESGANLKNPEKIPLYLTISGGERSHRHEVSLVYFPKGYSAPRSRILKSYHSRLKMKDGMYNSIAGVEISFSDYLTDFFRQDLQCSYLTSYGASDLRILMKLNFMIPFNYSVSYRIWKSSFREYIWHRIRLSCDYNPDSGPGISGDLSYDIKTGAYQRLKINILSDFKLFSIMEISPFLVYLSKTDMYNDFAIGIKQRMNLFKRTFGEIKFTYPVVSHRDERYSFYAKLNFNF